MITAEKILNELHIDSGQEELETVTRLIADASAFIRVQIKRGLTDEKVIQVNAPLYERLLITLVAHMYYNRTLDGDIPLGAKILLDNLKWEVLDVENGTVSA